MSEAEILDSIADSFIESARRDRFNGVTASGLLRIEPDPAKLRDRLSELIKHGQITAVFEKICINIHIKRLPDLAIEDQVKLLADEPLEEIGLYPTAAVVQPHVDLSKWQDRPFSKALLLAGSQLSFRAFDMGALERYVADPRYVVDFKDYMGTMSISNDFFSSEAHPERDKVSLQTFGLGFDDKRNPYVIVYLRYLAGLSAEHQQYWNSYVVDKDVRISEPYFQSSIEGQFWENRSVRYAIQEETRLIRTLSEAIWGHSLFRAPVEGDVPIGLTSFLRNTAANFDQFVMALDKLLSDGIDVKFFQGRVPLETETSRSDGKVIVQKKGSLKLLEEWLLKEIIWDDPSAFLKVVIQPLRTVRRLRQAPAHAFTPDTFSEEYGKKRKRLLWEVFNSLSNIRATFARHPSAGHIKVPDWLDSDRIDVF